MYIVHIIAKESAFLPQSYVGEMVEPTLRPDKFDRQANHKVWEKLDYL